ncbi:response regulator transcription factor [Nocardioides luteus]|uniref:response regulator transcription factor n=1 Tax=Nocardioides luteus TaxID=1844 RepID=UPI0018CA84E1|nr:response regulator transcription factor [Nocardioides luteus]MBG6098798.1 DNA-binding NarL/FixJ family response regulator [Nocardioides luteus]
MSMSGPVRVAVVSPQEVVERGITSMLDDYPDRVVVTALPSARSDTTGFDLIVYDTYGLFLDGERELAHLLHETDAKVLIYSRDLRPDLHAQAYALGARAWISMSADAAELVRSIERTAAGEPINEPPSDRQGAAAGLTVREIEVLKLITQGLPNQEIAKRLAMSGNTLKSHIRRAYRKIHVTTRSQAVSWAIAHGLTPPVEPPRISPAPKGPPPPRKEMEGSSA